MPCSTGCVVMIGERINMPLKGCEQIKEYKKKNGEVSKNHYCMDCGKEISVNAQRCNSCNVKKYWQNSEYRKNKSSENSGKNNFGYKDGRTLKKYYCIDCGKELKYYRAKRCPSCANRIITKKNWQNPKYREEMADRSGNYKDGRCMRKYYCVNCGKEISGHRSIRCGSCANKITTKKRWQNVEYRKIRIEQTRKQWQDGVYDGISQSPSNPEKKIMEMLEELKLEYIFQFRPKKYRKTYDFYIPSMNLLIEYDSKYWHSFPEHIKRDIEKTEHAKNNGYELLRFNEDNLDNLKDVIREGNNEINYVSY